MEFFRNLTAASAGSDVIKRPLTETGKVINIIKPTPIPTPDPQIIPNPKRPPAPEDPKTRVPIVGGDPMEGYFGGGGGFSFGAEEEVVPETTEVVEKKSNVGKTMLILAAVGLGLWLLSGGKKVKVK